MLSKVFAVSISLAVFFVICETSTPVRKCSDELPLPLYVQIDDCEEMPCTVVKGTTAIMDVQFVALKEETYKVTADVYARVLGLSMPYPLPSENADVCNNLLYNAYCPLYAGEDVTYRIYFPLDPSLPEVSVKAEVKLVDEEKNSIACFVADLKVRKRRILQDSDKMQ